MTDMGPFQTKMTLLLENTNICINNTGKILYIFPLDSVQLPLHVAKADRLSSEEIPSVFTISFVNSILS